MKRFIISALLCASIFSFSSCSSGGTSVKLEANDAMQFSQTEIRVKAGEPVTLTLSHTGTMDKTSMGHDFVLLKEGTDVAAFAHEALSAQATDYIPQSQMASIIAHTKLLGGGESDTITFTVADKGTYDYVCSFPGHSALMKGQLIVE